MELEWKFQNLATYVFTYFHRNSIQDGKTGNIFISLLTNNKM